MNLMYTPATLPHHGEDEAVTVLLDDRPRRAMQALALSSMLFETAGFLVGPRPYKLPDGRYLVLTGVPHASRAFGDDLGPMLLHDIDANRTVPLLSRLPYFLPSVVYDWTPDGRLLVALDDNLLGLIVPDTGQVRLLRHNAGACTSVAWLDE